MVNREKDKLKRLHILEASKPLPEHDLSLTPYFVAKPLPGFGINEVVKHFEYKKHHINVKVGKKKILVLFLITY